MAALDTKDRNAIYKDIDNTTIPQEMKLMYLVASACQAVVEDVHNRIKTVFKQHGLIARENDLLKGLNDYCKSVKSAQFHFYNRVNPKIVNATWGIGTDEGEAGKVELYDRFNSDACEIVRLIMLYVDRSTDNEDVFKKTFESLCELPSQGIFNNEDIERFKLK